MDKLKAMATFVRIVDSGSLTAAATAAGQSTAAVVRSLAALEQHLGVRLLNRNTRRLALTDEGAEFLTWSRQVLAQFEELEQRFEQRHQQPRGVLRLTAPVAFGQQHVLPLVNAFLEQHPQMQVELILLDRMVDLLEEGLDLALRIGHLPDSSMVAIPLGKTRPVVCASPGFMREFGALAHPRELQGCACIVFLAQGRQWMFNEQGMPLVQQVEARLLTNQIQVARQACLHGLGVARLLHYQVADALAEGALLRQLQDYEVEEVPIQLAYPHARLLSPRVRVFMDWMVPRLRAAIPLAD